MSIGEAAASYVSRPLGIRIATDADAPAPPADPAHFLQIGRNQ
jgi:hypothetical protein